MYQFIERLHTLYGLLQDDQSKEIFLARFALDMDGWFMPNIIRLASQGCKLGFTQPQKDVLKKLNREHKKIILYGTS